MAHHVSRAYRVTNLLLRMYFSIHVILNGIHVDKSIVKYAVFYNSCFLHGASWFTRPRYILGLHEEVLNGHEHTLKPHAFLTVHCFMNLPLACISFRSSMLIHHATPCNCCHIFIFSFYVFKLNLRGYSI